MKFLSLLLLLSSLAHAGNEVGTAGQVLRIPNAGGRGVYGAVDLAQPNAVASVLPTTHGGTEVVSSGVIGNHLVSDGSKWSSAPATVGISATVSASALTVSMKQADGSTDCSASAPCYITYRSSTATSGAAVTRAVTSSVSVVAPSGTSIGTTSGGISYIYVYAIDNAGTTELGLINANQLDEGALQSSTAISGGATSGVLYSTSARSSKAVHVIGRILISEATAGTWATSPTEVSGLPFQKSRFPTYQTFTSSGTYTTPTGVLYIMVEMAGGGGGGAGSGTASSSSDGGTGGVSTFGTSFLTASGGNGGAWGGAGGSGGSFTINSGCNIGSWGAKGNGGQGFQTQTVSSSTFAGAIGGGSALFAGGGGGVNYNSAGEAGGTNTGGGGSGGGSNNTVSAVTGSGGGGGGSIKCGIYSPLSSYAVVINNGGTAGGAGTSGLAGGAGAKGRVNVWEFYQ